MIGCAIFVITLATFFLLIIVLNKAYHTVPMMLVANTCLVKFILASDILGTVVFILQNDLK
jgi:hypothetical protein